MGGLRRYARATARVKTLAVKHQEQTAGDSLPTNEEMIRNPHFHLEDTELDADMARMAREPVALTRPVVILGGWHSPGLANWGVESVLRPHTSGQEQDFLSITYPLRFTLRSAADAAARLMRSRGWWDRELDLIGVSMGGVIARGLAADAFGHGPLNVKRIITIATPNRGAKIARNLLIDKAAWDLRPASEFIARLNGPRSGDGPELICYGALRDWWIGARNTAPPGMHPHWVDVAPGMGRLCSHFAINHDRRVLADIARRLRAEEPIAKAAIEPPRQ